jgi:molybdate transport system substrate-binding protein
MSIRRRIVAVGVLLMAAATACSTSAGDSSPSPVKLTVFAAASLTKVFPQIGARFTKDHPGVTFAWSFGGTDQLAAQIQEGARADVFAGASTKYGDQLADGGQIDPYTIFCTNQLVLITPKANPAGIDTLQDLATKHVKLVIGSDTVPIGTYTRTVLTHLDAVYGDGYSDAVLGTVVSNEDSVTSIVAKVVSGEADAGFVYVTDALAAGTQVGYQTLPPDAQAVAEYPVAVVKGSRQPAMARQFAQFVLAAPAQDLLKKAGFGPPPSS